jgi:hypothetical protein
MLEMNCGRLRARAQAVRGSDECQTSGPRQTHWVRLDDGGGPLDQVALDDVAQDRSLGEERDAAELPGFALEDADEEAADDLPLPLGRRHALEPGDELFGRVDADDV